MTSVPPNQQVFQRRQSSSTALFCREDTVLRRFISSQGNEGARLKVEYRTGGPMSRLCNRPQSSAGLMRDVPRPSLEPPSEAAIVSGRRRIGSFSSHPRVASDLSSVELASHYADQLRDQGWTLEARKEDRGAVNQSWRLEDDSGCRGFLVVMPFPGTLEKKILFHIAQQWNRQRPNRASPGRLRGAALPHARPPARSPRCERRVGRKALCEGKAPPRPAGRNLSTCRIACHDSPTHAPILPSPCRFACASTRKHCPAHAGLDSSTTSCRRPSRRPRNADG